MSKSLIITEKPSVAQEFAKVLHFNFQNSRKDGYLENDKYVITWCVGHLVQMSYPEVYDEKYKTWRLEDLPFLPKVYRYEVIKDVKKQYKIVHGMLMREDIDRVYWAGDSGKEGQTIEENIRMYGGVRDGMEERRVWIDSQTEEEIMRGLKEAKPMSDYKNLGESGIMRTIEDYSIGINFSRVMSVKYGKLLNDAAGNKKYKAIAVGRVMTCVLGMIVIREREIRNFVETPFYRVIGNFGKNGEDLNIIGEWKATEKSKYFNSPLLYKENGFKKEESASELINSCEGKNAVVKNVDNSTSKKRPPLLYNLAELQAECTKRFKISPDQTLQIAQTLYEKKLTTYPRTDARVLSTAIAKEIYKNISKLKNYQPVTEFVDRIMREKRYSNIAKTQYTDDSKVTDHYAIIPTGQLTELNSLNSLQKNVYDMIVKRFLSIFYEPAVYQNVKLTAAVGEEEFFASNKILKEPGFYQITGIPKKNNSENNDEKNINPKEFLEFVLTLNKGDELAVKGYEIKEGKTSPPKRYTTGSMILAMENAGQLIEDDELREQIKGTGIGTSATRANIIEKLINISYLNRSKNQVLSPSNFGEMIFELVSMTVPALLSPKMSASWEKGLEGIVEGSVQFEVYREKLEGFVRKETEKMINQDIQHDVVDRISNFAGKNGKGIGARRKIGVKCPRCGGEIVTTPFGYGCANYKNDKSGCNFQLGEIAGILLNEQQVKTLLEEGKTDTIRGFKSKAGKKFDACLKYEITEEGKGKITFDFESVKPEELEDIACPACGGKILKTYFGFACSNYDSQNPFACKFSLGQIAGKNITESQLRQLVSDKKTEVIRGFKSKAGKKFDAVLKLDEDNKIVFDFDEIKPEEIKDVTCPNCGGKIIKTPFGYGCSNYKKDDENSCKFVIGQIAGKDLNVTQVKQLLTNGKTDTIRGFKSKSGKKFDAVLKLVNETDDIDNSVVNDKKFSIVFDFDEVKPEEIKDVVCPNCGGKIIKTPFGYGCSNYKKDDPESCRFNIGELAGKNLTQAQVKQLLNDGRTETIRGFKSKAGKKFDARITLSKDEQTQKIVGLKFSFDDIEPPKLKGVKCPVCGGDINITPFGYGCSNYKKDDENSCKFFIGKIASVKLKEAQVKELLTKKKTDVISGFVAKTGMKFDAPLKLTEDGQVTFDFPEKPKPIETTVKCPRCQKQLMKTQWRLECDCGFKIWHTVAKVPLTDEIFTELFEKGKTSEVIKGFKSKAGNEFDAYLVYDKEKEEVSFDFNIPKEVKKETDDALFYEELEENPIDISETK